MTEGVAALTPGSPAAPEWLNRLVVAVHEADPASFSPMPAEGVEGLRRAAVLVLFGEGVSGPDVLLLQRSDDLRHHAGQPAFPGGGIDPTDDGPIAAALREAAEETGADAAGIDVLTTMPQLWLPPSGNLVTPVIAWWREPSDVGPVDAVEVAAVSRVALDDLADPANRVMVKHRLGYASPGFRVAGMLVWGFTAGILDRLLRLGGWEQAWDKDVVLPMPVPARRD
ncbi:MAG TPA: CoA pyrophosphatase [Mycobacteriales bacterium]|jgi:8-oxo-dGTP pyrophosphatase MutT (NUDIX family)|nr:CoA pyrophosphatase [Mycobacteriales bacterium]